jgi:hypothetical protein
MTDVSSVLGRPSISESLVSFVRFVDESAHETVIWSLQAANLRNLQKLSKHLVEIAKKSIQ